MRIADEYRKTLETEITLHLCLDGGKTEISTGIGFFDHMLNSFAVHGGFGIQVKADGDLDVDCHHTVEDTGIVLGKAFEKALGDKSGIKRFGNCTIPMDESLAFASVDISGRPFLVFKADFKQETIGSYDACMTEEFMRAFAMNSGITLHTQVLYGNNAHHQTEAMFKAVAHALKIAVTPHAGGALSAKGSL